MRVFTWEGLFTDEGSNFADNPLNYVPFSLSRGAFFAARPKSGIKIISLNTNFCNNQNWWLLINSTDPADQLQWLIKQLTESEELGEMVGGRLSIAQTAISNYRF